MLLPYSISSGALGSPNLFLSFSIITLALSNTITLIITLISIKFQPLNQYKSTDTGTQPSSQPTMAPSGQPTSQPSGQPTSQPTRQPTGQPSSQVGLISLSLTLTLSLRVHVSILVASCVTWSGALDSSGLLLPYPISLLSSPTTPMY